MSHSNYLRQVKHLKDDFSELIPPPFSEDFDKKPATRFKARKAWFRLVGYILISGVKANHLPLSFLKKFNQFERRNKETDFYHRETTREDIHYANKILNNIINELSLE